MRVRFPSLGFVLSFAWSESMKKNPSNFIVGSQKSGENHSSFSEAQQHSPLGTRMGRARVVGKDPGAEPLVGLRVASTCPQLRDLGDGTIVKLGKGYVSVEWESGRRDACLLTGGGGMYNLIMAEDIDLIDCDDQEADLLPAPKKVSWWSRPSGVSRGTVFLLLMAACLLGVGWYRGRRSWSILDCCPKCAATEQALSKAQDAAMEAQSQLKESSLIIEGLRARIEEGRARVVKKSFIDAAECKVTASHLKECESGREAAEAEASSAASRSKLDAIRADAAEAYLAAMEPLDGSTRENQLKDEVMRLTPILKNETAKKEGSEGRCAVQLRVALPRLADAEKEVMRASAEAEWFKGELEKASSSPRCSSDIGPSIAAQSSWRFAPLTSIVDISKALLSSYSNRSLAQIYKLMAGRFDSASASHPHAGVQEGSSPPDAAGGNASKTLAALLIGPLVIIVAIAVALAPLSSTTRSDEAQDLLDQVLLLHHDVSEAYRRGNAAADVSAGEGLVESAGISPLRGKWSQVSDTSVSGTPSRLLDGSGSDLLEELEIEQQRRRKVEVLLSRETEARQKLEGDVEVGRARARDLERKVACLEEDVSEARASKDRLAADLENAIGLSRSSDEEREGLRWARKELERRVAALEEDLTASNSTRRKLEKIISSETEARQSLEDYVHVSMSPLRPGSTAPQTPANLSSWGSSSNGNGNGNGNATGHHFGHFFSPRGGSAGVGGTPVGILNSPRLPVISRVPSGGTDVSVTSSRGGLSDVSRLQAAVEKEGLARAALELDLIAVRKERDDLMKRLEAAEEREGQEGGEGQGQGAVGRQGVGKMEKKGEIEKERAEKIGEIQKREKKGEIEQTQGDDVEGKRRLEELKGLLRKQDDDIASLRAESMGAKRERDSLSVEMDALRQETQKLATERDSATAEATGLSKVRDALRAEVASLTEARDAASGQRDARAESLSKEVMSLKREKERLARRCEDAEKKLNASKGGGGGEAVDVLCGELDMISRKFAALEKEANQLRSDNEEIVGIRGERDALSTRISSLEESNKAQSVENASLSEQVQALVAERDAAVTERKVLSDQVEAAQAERDTLLEIKDAAEAAIQETDVDLKRIRAKCAEQEEMIARLQKEDKGSEPHEGGAADIACMRGLVKIAEEKLSSCEAELKQANERKKMMNNMWKSSEELLANAKEEVRKLKKAEKERMMAGGVKGGGDDRWIEGLQRRLEASDTDLYRSKKQVAELEKQVQSMANAAIMEAKARLASEDSLNMEIAALQDELDELKAVGSSKSRTESEASCSGEGGDKVGAWGTADKASTSTKSKEERKKRGSELLNDLKLEAEDSANEIVRLGKELRKAQDMMFECEKRRRKLSETSDKLQEELKAARESAEAAQRGEREAESRYAKAVESLGQVRDAVSKESQSDQDVARLIQSAQDAQQAVEICEASMSEIQGQLSEARSLNSTLRGQLDDEQKKVTSLRRDMEEASELIRDLQDKEALAQAKILKFKIDKEDIEDVQKQLSDALDANESMRGNLERSEAMQEELRGKLTRMQSAYAEIFMVSNQKTKNPLQRVASADSSDGAVRKGRRASFDPDGSINSPRHNMFSSSGDDFSRVTSAPGRCSSTPRHFNSSSSPPSTCLQSPASTMSATSFSIPSPRKRRGSVVAFSPSEISSSPPPPIEESRVLSNFSPVGRSQSFSVNQKQSKAATPRSVMRQSSAGLLSSTRQALPAASSPVAAITGTPLGDGPPIKESQNEGDRWSVEGGRRSDQAQGSTPPRTSSDEVSRSGADDATPSRTKPRPTPLDTEEPSPAPVHILQTLGDLISLIPFAAPAPPQHAPPIDAAASLPLVSPFSEQAEEEAVTTKHLF